tara:strand:- start:239 stop:613 length:375 start_codon:yes stop_codon:yes gene_type:complete
MNEDKIINLTNILKNQSTISLNDYEKYQLKQQYNKLYTNSEIENDKNKQERMNQRFYNLSLKQILNNLSLTLIKIMNEISIYMEKSDRTTKELIDIFTKDDRMIYVGILLIILSLGIFFINISS